MIWKFGQKWAILTSTQVSVTQPVCLYFTIRILKKWSSTSRRLEDFGGIISLFQHHSSHSAACARPAKSNRQLSIRFRFHNEIILSTILSEYKPKLRFFPVWLILFFQCLYSNYLDSIHYRIIASGNMGVEKRESTKPVTAPCLEGNTSHKNRRLTTLQSYWLDFLFVWALRAIFWEPTPRTRSRRVPAAPRAAASCIPNPPAAQGSPVRWALSLTWLHQGCLRSRRGCFRRADCRLCASATRGWCRVRSWITSEHKVDGIGYEVWWEQASEKIYWFRNRKFFRNKYDVSKLCFISKYAFMSKFSKELWCTIGTNWQKIMWITRALGHQAVSTILCLCRLTLFDKGCPTRFCPYRLNMWQIWGDMAFFDWIKIITLKKYILKL
jgi:hypothetical protein